MDNKLKLKQSQALEVMNFDGTNDYIIFSPVGSVDVSNNRKMTMQMILDATSGFNNNGLFNFRNPAGAGIGSVDDSWEAQFIDDHLHIDCGGPTGTAKYSLLDFPLHQSFNIEFIKSTKVIESLKINGNTITPTGTSSATASSNDTNIGRVGSVDYFLKAATVWDIEIRDNDDNRLIHKWLGYGIGANQNSAWVDNASDANGAISGDPSTRFIYASGYSTLGNRKLKLTGQANAPSSVQDIDGNVYTTVTIGSQTWMGENLKTTKYKDGTSIPYLTVNADWINTTAGAYCWTGNYVDNSVYGALYNVRAVQDASGIAPEGWRVATYADWDTLIAYVGGESVAGYHLKESGTTHWTVGNTGVDTYGFTALPGGYRVATTGDFAHLQGQDYWSTDSSQYQYMLYDSNYTYTSPSAVLNQGRSVRCVKESASSSSMINKLLLYI